MTTAIYPGTFDPVTKGHEDIALRASNLFDKVIVAVADTSSKKTLFTIDERVAMAASVLSQVSNVEVIPFRALVTDVAREKNVSVIVRGVRAVSDFDYEFQMAGMNRQLNADVETVRKTYQIIYDIIRKINGEDNKINISIPHEEEFKYAFINSIQRFNLPEKLSINHNDLSNFSRYFFPYVA